jgi:hypothetical protein
MRDPVAVRDQIWLIPYNQSEMSNLAIPSTLSFPIRAVDTNDDYILVLDNSQILWAFKDILSQDIQIKKVVQEKVKNFKVWGDKVIVYIENNELLQIPLKSLDPSPVKPGLCISVEQISCGLDH